MHYNLCFEKKVGSQLPHHPSKNPQEQSHGRTQFKSSDLFMFKFVIPPMRLCSKNYMGEERKKNWWMKYFGTWTIFSTVHTVKHCYLLIFLFNAPASLQFFFEFWSFDLKIISFHKRKPFIKKMKTMCNNFPLGIIKEMICESVYICRQEGVKKHG